MMPGMSFSQNALTTSGVMSLGPMPVPPVVNTASAPAARAASSSARSRSASSGRTVLATSQPPSPTGEVLFQQLLYSRPAAVFVHPGRGAVAQRDHPHVQHLGVVQADLVAEQLAAGKHAAEQAFGRHDALARGLENLAVVAVTPLADLRDLQLDRAELEPVQNARLASGPHLR